MILLNLFYFKHFYNQYANEQKEQDFTVSCYYIRFLPLKRKLDLHTKQVAHSS